MSDYKECLSDKDLVKYEYHLSVLKDIVLRNLEDANICIRDGFYTLFAQDAKEAGYDIISVSKAYFDGYCDVFLKKHPKETNNWEQVRIQASIAAMQGICASPVNVIGNEISLAEVSVKFADALVKELKGE
jgi:hypothetical protein